MVSNIGKKSGYNAHTWTKHGKSKFLDYSKPKEAVKYYPKCSYKGTASQNTQMLNLLKQGKLKKAWFEGYASFFCL